MAEFANSSAIRCRKRGRSIAVISHHVLAELLIGLLLLPGATLAQEPITDQGGSDLKLFLDRIEPSVVPAGSTLSLVTLIQNAGPLPSSRYTVEILLYQDEDLSEGEVLLYKVSAPPLQANSGTGLPWQGELPDTLGTHWVRVCLVAEEAESNVDRVCTPAQQLFVPHIDLAVSDIRARPHELVSGVPIVLQATVENLGSEPSDATTVRYVLSINPSISRSDKLLAVGKVPTIEAGATWFEPARSVLEAAPRGYWLGACVDPVDGEVSIENNCSYGLQVTILKDEFPDLAVRTVKVNPEVWAEGVPVDFYAEIVNVGEKVSSATELKFYLSEDADISDADILLGTKEIKTIAPGKQFNAYLLVEPPAFPGLYWLGVCIEPGEGELDTFNNCYTGIQVEVTAFEFSE